MAMENISRTIFAGTVQTNSYIGIPHQYREKTTLNELFGIQANVTPDQTKAPTLEVFTIGIGGHKNKVGADGITLVEPRQHSAVDGAMFTHIPFAMRELSADLPVTERAKLALRNITSHQGKSYITYWGLRIPKDGLVTTERIHTYENGVLVKDDPFVPDNSVLRPVPYEVSNTGINIIDGRYAVATAPIQFRLSRAQIDEILNAAKILYGSVQYGVISEIGLVTGVNRQVTATTPGQSSFQFNEILGAQTGHFMNVFYPLNYINNELIVDIDVGAQEPMLKLNTIGQDSTLP